MKLPAAVRALAADLLADVDTLARGMNDHLFATMPELADIGDDELREETRASSQANIDQVLRLMRLGAATDTLVVPVDAAEYVRGLVRRGVTLPVLLRTYRLGHAWLWDRWWHALNERVPDQAERDIALEQSSAFLFAYVDRISDVLVQAYGTERERMVRGADQLRSQTVRAILDGEAIDEEVATRRLGYDLRRHHVAVRVSSPPTEIRGLERAATEAAAALGPGEPVVIRSGVASLDLWWGSFDPPTTDGLEAYEPPDGVDVAFGAPGFGVPGFRRSHAEALQAARVAALADGRGQAVTSYARIELVSLLASDLPRARAFVAAQLGALAGADETTERLRETVLAYLAAAGASSRVAKHLFVHQNTVTYRIKRAEELLGRRITERPVELSCALTLAATLGPAVLASEPL